MIRAVIFDWGNTLMRDFTEYDGPMVNWPKVQAVPGAIEALEYLHDRYVLAVGSNAGDSDGELVAQALDRVGMRQYLRHFFTNNELGTAKPDPEFFREILRRIEVLPQEGIMVGDNYEKDIVPAKAVGLRTVWLSAGGTAEEHPCADAVICTMNELADAASRIRA